MSQYLLAALAGAMLVGSGPTPPSPSQPGGGPRFELRPGEHSFRVDGRPAFVLGRNPPGS